MKRARSNRIGVGPLVVLPKPPIRLDILSWPLTLHISHKRMGEREEEYWSMDFRKPLCSPWTEQTIYGALQMEVLIMPHLGVSAK